MVGWIDKLYITYNKLVQGPLSTGIEVTDRVLTYKIKQGSDFSERLKYRRSLINSEKFYPVDIPVKMNKINHLLTLAPLFLLPVERK